jgi:ribosome assembly protein YihI (activator of Der GTPase)
MEVEASRKVPDSIAERSKRHRARRKVVEEQMAVAIAKLVLGQHLGDHQLVLKDFLDKFTAADAMPDDLQTMIDRAIDRLGTARPRF